MTPSTNIIVAAAILLTVASTLPTMYEGSSSAVHPHVLDPNTSRLGIPLHNHNPKDTHQVALKSMSGLPLRNNNPKQVVKRSTVLQVRNPNFDYYPSGPAAHLKALKKYNAAVPRDVHNAVAKRSTYGTVGAAPEACDSEYLAPVQIGTPAQTLYLDFDTGSSDLWVFSTDLDASQVNGQTLFDSSQSSTARNLTGSTFVVSYNDGGSASGSVITDKVIIGGLTVNSMAIEIASEVSSSFSSVAASDGMLGLAFNRLNGILPNQQNTFINSALDMAIDVFTADLKKGAPGSYDFGYVDSSKHSGKIFYTPVNKAAGYWGFTASGYAIGNGSFQGTPIYGIADTGTSLILLPSTMVSSYYSQVDDAAYSKDFGAMIYPCSSEIPSFTFGVGSEYKGVVPAEYMIYGQVNSSHCYGGIQDNGGASHAVFGDILLKSQFVVFHVGNTELGFAAKDFE